jgi:hypothetical protein
MDRKVYVIVPVSLILRVSEGTEVQEVLDAMELSAEIPANINANIEDISKGDAIMCDSK